ncbi:hypothetical protein [Streptomyces netropsis]|uniref:Secreted protein n=1 Tax=Streptomyces netropsis TaxID=55404 RepID=A0A7W7PE41_STRNE|nr:hypothetical protein [Streptomyces netropsis]MBB4886262.1 hypothetical protein [Streptomyces netropsis]GGR15272.1 hypothetical protein GCM10010219_20240 [Streptomyces netropsis]
MRNVMSRPALRRVGVLTATAAAIGLGLAAPAQAGPGPIPPLTASEQALLNSSAPKAVELDPATGRILSVKPQSTDQGISQRSGCNSGDGCYLSGRVPYAHRGFYGSRGTARGNWPYRIAYNTGRYTASACWTLACAQRSFPPNTYVDFSGALVTGTSFRIH